MKKKLTHVFAIAFAMAFTISAQAFDITKSTTIGTSWSKGKVITQVTGNITEVSTANVALPRVSGSGSTYCVRDCQAANDGAKKWATDGQFVKNVKTTTTLNQKTVTDTWSDGSFCEVASTFGSLTVGGSYSKVSGGSKYETTYDNVAAVTGSESVSGNVYYDGQKVGTYSDTTNYAQNIHTGGSETGGTKTTTYTSGSFIR